MAKILANNIKWLPDPEEHDYPAAESYLSLIYQPSTVDNMLARLRAADVMHFKAKDIFRASGLSLLGVSNLHVRRNRSKLKRNIPLSPLLLVRDPANGKVVIADGYHRLCTVYPLNEDAVVPCKII